MNNRNLQIRVVALEWVFQAEGVVYAKMKLLLWATGTHVPWGDSKTAQFSSHFPKCHISVVQARAFGHQPSVL